MLQSLNTLFSGPLTKSNHIHTHSRKKEQQQQSVLRRFAFFFSLQSKNEQLLPEYMDPVRQFKNVLTSYPHTNTLAHRHIHLLRFTGQTKRDYALHLLDFRSFARIIHSWLNVINLFLVWRTGEYPCYMLSHLFSCFCLFEWLFVLFLFSFFFFYILLFYFFGALSLVFAAFFWFHFICSLLLILDFVFGELLVVDGPFFLVRIFCCFRQFFPQHLISITPSLIVVPIH